MALYEMRPNRRSAAHRTDAFAELVCSNSLKSEQPDSAPWLLKQEMRRLGSLLLRAGKYSASTGRPCLDGRSRGIFGGNRAGH